MKTKFGEIR